MKFLAGFLTGAIVVVVILGFIGARKGLTGVDNGLTLFPQAKECVTRKNLRVFQALGPGRALAKEVNASYDSPIMYLLGKDDETFYDDEIVKVPAKQCAKQVGTYFYQTRDKNYKTVPAVVIEQG